MTERTYRFTTSEIDTIQAFLEEELENVEDDPGLYNEEYLAGIKSLHEKICDPTFPLVDVEYELIAAVPKLCALCGKQEANDRIEHDPVLGDIAIFDTRYSFRFEVKDRDKVIASGSGGHCDLDTTVALLRDAIEPRNGDAE